MWGGGGAGVGKECSVAFVNPYRRWGVRAFFFFLLFLSNQTELERFLTFSVLWPRICNNVLGFRYSMKLVFFRFFAEESVGNLLRQLSYLNFNTAVPFSTKEISDFLHFPLFLGNQTPPHHFLIIVSLSGFVFM